MDDEPLPLSTLLSRVLVALTIELDHGLEQALPHHTSAAPRAGGPPRGPWLVSWTMWAMVLQHVEPGGIRLGDLERTAFLPPAVLGAQSPGLVRWGYLTVGTDPAGGRDRPSRRDRIVRLTPAGSQARAIGADLPAVVEARWRERYGADRINALRDALVALVSRFGEELPDAVPLNGAADGRVDLEHRPVAVPVPATAPLPILLAKALVRATLDVEAGLPGSLVHVANVVRVLGPEPEPAAGLPRRTGVAKEALAMMLRHLERTGMVALGRAGRARTAQLTAAGLALQAASRSRGADVESAWTATYGRGVVADLRRSLTALAGTGELASSPLRAAVEPPPGTWRATRPAAEVLPHHPVITHRGGYPDGS